VLLGGLDNAQDGAALASHAEAARSKFGLEMSGDFSFRKGHGCNPRSS
jgi:hypothetical protein